MVVGMHSSLPTSLLFAHFAVCCHVDSQHRGESHPSSHSSGQQPLLKVGFDIVPTFKQKNAEHSNFLVIHVPGQASGMVPHL